MKAFRLSAVMNVPTPEAPQVVGRDAERAAAEAFLDAVPRGFAALLLEGEPGIGKTTLWRDAVASARRRSYRILTARAVGSEAQLSFMGLDDLLGGVLEDTLPGLPTPQRRALEVALLRTDAEGAGPDQRAVSLAALGILRILVASGPVILAVDDVQWLDEPSAAVVEFCLRRLGSEPVGFLGTFRVEDRSLGIPLGLDRGEVAERLQRLRVHPLTVGAIHQVIRARLETTFPRPTLIRIHETSGGNPFFALEIARALREADARPASGDPLPIPPTLTELLRERLARLPRPTREALLAVAALGHPAPAVVEAAVGDADAAREALGEGARAGVIEIGLERIRFTHPLLASAHYAGTPLRERRAMHRRLAAVLPDAEERARHLALGTAGPDASAAEALEEAATAATNRGAPHSAAELAELAARLTPPELAADVRRRTLHAGSGYFEAGDAAHALRLLEAVLGSSAPGSERAEALWRIAMVRGEVDGIATADPIYERALAEPDVRPSLAARIHQSLAYGLMLEGHMDRGSAHAREALRLAERESGPAPLAMALGMLGLFEFCLGRGVRRDIMERALALEEAAGQPLWADDAPSTLYAALLLWSGDLGEARVRLGALYDAAAERGDQGAQGILVFFLSLLECRAGDYAAAARYAAEDEDLFSLTQREAERAPVLYCRAQADAHLGRIEAARAEAADGVASSRATGYAWFEIHNLWVLGFLELSLGDPAAAAEYLGAAAGRLNEIGVVETGVFMFPPDHIEALVALGRLDDAGTSLHEFEERGRATDRAWALATAARCRALLSAAGGDLEGALDHAARALHEHDRVPMPFELARTLLVQGQILRRTKRKRPARDSLERALRMFDELGARLWADRARAELGRIGGRTTSPTELTPTERRVAEAVASGLSNHQAADSLFVSVHTVEDNLTRVYRKLGVRSRTELSRKLAQHGPAGPSEDRRR
ncbi:MAG TPA: AAA family ATPase [Actinomycetota bacterium]